MGASASIESSDKYMSLEEVKIFAGEQFDQSLWDNAEKDGDGKVAKEAVMKAAEPVPAAEAAVEAEPVPAAETEPAPTKRKKRLSVVEGNGNVTDSGRRNSILAEKTHKEIDVAAVADQPKILMETITKDQETPEGTEFASWALSCGTSLCQGNREARKQLFDGNYCDQIVKYLELYPDDVYVQYQGLHAMGNICEGTGAAEKFGHNGMKLVVTALGDTDMNELALAGIRTLSILCNSAEKNSTYGAESDLKETLETLKEEFKKLNNFCYSASELLKQLNKTNKFKWEEETAPIEKNFTSPAAASSAEDR